MLNYSIELNSLEETHQLAKLIKSCIDLPIIISLNGDLGAGKTTLVREIILAYNVAGRVKSPTFTLLEEYQIGNEAKILHFDLYRFASADEWIDLGFDELLQGRKFIAFIEWAEKALELLPHIDWSISLVVIDEYTRNLTIQAQTQIGEECLKKLIKIVEI